MPERPNLKNRTPDRRALDRQALHLAAPDVTLAAGEALGPALVQCTDRAVVVYLAGPLGAGKTTLVRGILRGLGHTGRVPSPTYTLIEPYDVPPGRVYHVDLYRLGSESEVDELGLAELPAPGVVMLVEWPEHGGTRLPAADLEITLTIDGQGRQLEAVAATRIGRDLLRRLGDGWLNM